MKVLLDECVDWRLSREIVGHDVKTTRQMGWSTIKNGDLLAFDLAVIVLRATSNRLADLKPLVSELLASIPIAKRGVASFVGV